MKRILPLLFILVGCKENTTPMQRLPKPSDYDTTLVNQPGKVVDTMRPIMNIIFAHDTIFIHDTIMPELFDETIVFGKKKQVIHISPADTLKFQKLMRVLCNGESYKVFETNQ